MAETNLGNKENGEHSSTEQPIPQKIIIDTQPPRSGSCVFHNFFYALGAVIACLYLAYVIDHDSFGKYSQQYSYLGHIHDFFHTIEKYSPFHDFLESDEDYIARLRAEHEAAQAAKPPQTRIFTKAELAKFDGSAGSPGIYLALLGVVYDVSKGASYYGPGGGYAFFSGKDGSRAFVTGQFDEEGLVENVEGLKSADYLGLQEWSEFYGKDYVKVGVLEGLYYNNKGEVTEEWKKVQRWIQEAKEEKDKQDVEKQMFPPCNVEWSKEKGSRYWCSNRSGGVQRAWVGVPRRLFYPGREERCACIRDSGPPSTDPGASSNRGDLDSPHVKEYVDCQPTSLECWKK